MTDNLEPGNPNYHEAKAVEYRTAADMIRSNDLDSFEAILDAFPDFIVEIHEDIIRLQNENPEHERDHSLIEQANENIQEMNKRRNK